MIPNKIDLFEKELSYKIRGVFIDISINYGYQFKEYVYHNLCKEKFIENKLIFYSNRRISLYSLGTKDIIGYFVPDFIVEDKIIIEIKAQKQITGEHISQLIRYLNMSKYEIGFLINFGTPRVQIVRRIFTNDRKVAEIH